MSGVAKDDTNPTQPTDETVPAAGAAEAGNSENQTSEADARNTRRNAPHLRVVSDNDFEFAAAAPVDGPHLRIGAVMRAARENAGYSLDQVSKETRVHLSHLRAIEDMTPNLLGAPVYAKGYIKSYARFLGMDEQTTLDRYLSECAILKDPEKQEIAPPASSKARKLPVAVPVLGILIVALVAGGVFVFLSNGDKQPLVAGEPAATAGVAAADGAADPTAAIGQRLRLVALRSGSVEVRSAKGDKYVHRDFVAGESYPVRVGAQWTVSVSDGSAFEWRLGDQSLGPLSEGGPVYSQSIDLAAQRAPLVTEPVIDPNAAVETPDPAAAAYPSNTAAPSTTTAPTAPRANPAPAKPKPKPPVATPPPATTQAPAQQQQVQTPPPARDPALAAYPDQ
ncbi:MAG: helix-turn-helix domain-containing protein [Hyphomonadaceae bacterium]